MEQVRYLAVSTKPKAKAAEPLAKPSLTGDDLIRRTQDGLRGFLLTF